MIAVDWTRFCQGKDVCLRASNADPIAYQSTGPVGVGQRTICAKDGRSASDSEIRDALSNSGDQSRTVRVRRLARAGDP